MYYVLVKLLLYVGLDLGSNLPFVFTLIWLFLHSLSKILSTIIPRSLRMRAVGQVPSHIREIGEFSRKSNLFFSFLIFFSWSRLSRDVRILLYKIRPGFSCFTCVSSPLQTSYIETRTARHPYPDRDKYMGTQGKSNGGLDFCG